MNTWTLEHHDRVAVLTFSNPPRNTTDFATPQPPSVTNANCSENSPPPVEPYDNGAHPTHTQTVGLATRDT